MSKEEFVKQLFRIFPDKNDHQLSMLVSEKPTWTLAKTSKQSPLSTHRRLKYYIDKNIRGIESYQEVKRLLAQYKNSKLEQFKQANKPVGYVRITESLQELYTSFLTDIEDINFHTLSFSKMLYPEFENYIRNKQHAKSTSLGIRKTLETTISTYLDLEARITNLKMEDTKIKDEDDLKKFQDQAKALIRWHLLQAGNIHPSAIHEASIMFNILFLSHDPQRSSYRGELLELFSSQLSYLKGLSKIGEIQFKKLEGILESIPNSDLKEDTKNLIDDYKENYMSSTSRKLRTGTIFHIHAEDISDLHFTESSVTSRNEKFSNYPHSYHRMDTWLRMDDNLESLIDKKLLKSLGLTLDEIKEFAIDFTSLSGKNAHVIKKLSKFYQRDGRPLLIVIYGKYDSTTFRQVQNDISRHKDGDNVRLITINQYLDLFKFSSDYKKMMIHLSNLAGVAIKGDKNAFDLLAEFDITNPNILQTSLFDF